MNFETELKRLADPKKAKILQRFFKTAKGEYGEGDIFLGITVPKTRQIAKDFWQSDLNQIQIGLKSKIHEVRLCALLILVAKYQKASDKEKKAFFNFYLKKTQYINNWDLVDLSAPKIVGGFLLEKNKDILYTLAKKKNLWSRRIAIISTYTFIKNGDFAHTLKIAEILLKDKEDLIHKAVGWMLREVGKKNTVLLEDFLHTHYKNIPRTTLRYAIEKMPEDKRRSFLNKLR